MEKISQAAVLVYVWDVAGGMTLADVYDDLQKLATLEQLTAREQGGGLLIVCNKMDRNPHFRAAWLLDPTTPDIHPYLLGEGAPPPLEMAKIIPPESIVTVSAKNAMNIEYLKEKLFSLIAGGDVQVSGTVVTNARHHDVLRRADAALADVLHGLNTNITGDFVAQDIRRALAALGEITGAIGVEDILGSIFSKFCIGK